MDTATLNNRNYQLPKKTLDVLNRIEALMNTEAQYERRQVTAVECLTAEYNFIIETLGAEKTAEVLGVDNLNDADTNEISVSVMKILTAYSEKVEKAKLEHQTQMLNDPKMKQMIDIVKTANKSSLPVFNHA